MAPKYCGQDDVILTYFYHQKVFLKVAPLVGEKGIQNFCTKKPETKKCGGIVKALCFQA